MSSSHGGTINKNHYKYIVVTSSAVITMIVVDIFLLLFNKSFSVIGYILMIGLLVFYYFAFDFIIQKLQLIIS